VLTGFPVSGICGNGIGGGIFNVLEIKTDSIKTTLDID
jgi:hypothetical protein